MVMGPNKYWYLLSRYNSSLLEALQWSSNKKKKKKKKKKSLDAQFGETRRGLLYKTGSCVRKFNPCCKIICKDTNNSIW